jgi:SAM-dependent methyltransferase
MPWYKVAGNRTLTVLQNFLTKRSLSEYHTGYRGYSTRFLRQVPFETNTNVFHFDTEILLQGFHINAKTVEIDIPTHYGDEICRVNGMRYAKDVLIATLKYRMHQMGMLCDLKYRNLSFDRYRDKTQGKYTSHTMALEEVARLAPRTLLDLGCGPGHIAARAKAMGISVTGVDAYEPIEGKMDRFVKVNLESLELPVDPFSFDVVLLLDVIEHLQDPEAFMVMLRNASTVLSDKNLFTRKSLLTTLRDCGYQIEKVRGVPPPFEAVMPGIFGKLFGTLSAGLAKLWPSMFSFQTLVVCRPMPGVRQLLSASERHLAQGDDAVVATLAALDKA